MKLEKITGYEGYYRSSAGNMFKKVRLGSLKKLIKVSKLPVKPVIIKKPSMVSHPFVNEFGEHVIIKCDPKLYAELMEGKKRQARNLDNVYGVGGNTGSGKTYLTAGTIGPIMDKNFRKAKIFFCGTDMINYTKTPECKDGDFLQLDETSGDGSGAKHQSPEYKALVNFLSTCRHRRFTIVLIMPEWFRLSLELATNRTNLLLMTNLEKGSYKRGFGTLFDKQKKKTLYLKNRQTLNYQGSPANYKFRFYKNANAIDFAGYEKAKLAFFTKTPDKKEKIDPNKARDEIILKLSQDNKLTQEQIGEIVNLDRTTVNKIIKQSQKTQK